MWKLPLLPYVLGKFQLHGKKEELRKKFTDVDCEGKTKPWINIQEVEGNAIFMCAPCVALTGDKTVTYLCKTSIFTKHEKSNMHQHAIGNKETRTNTAISPPCEQFEDTWRSIRGSQELGLEQHLMSGPKKTAKLVYCLAYILASFFKNSYL